MTQSPDANHCARQGESQKGFDRLYGTVFKVVGKELFLHPRHPVPHRIVRQDLVDPSFDRPRTVRPPVAQNSKAVVGHSGGGPGLVQKVEGIKQHRDAGLDALIDGESQ